MTEATPLERMLVNWEKPEKRFVMLPGTPLTCGEAAAAIRSALAPATQAVQDMVLVPREATNAMHIAALEAGLALMRECGVDGLSPFTSYPAPSKITNRVWSAMLDAATPNSGSGR
ncbi:MAG: hypothetical protein E5X86_19585 [Mesorhizobium sp.]|uniref:hypothetical protein n=1 Tax=Mesorhizobium sp. TaxID=1871066 RepID=UPI00122909B0|nr:hypothetical protein [Mesorhizobium sp.]TIO15576.1 MAG: hypothetical protein E5X86_19585 [Mesorhizobium sp.]TJW49326.1 MAG: hypothetical protein E5X65_34350 [Mesorhizobium sp.]